METRPLVLVVDDEPTVLRFISLHLEAHGFRVVTAANGAEGLATAAKLRPDVLLLDVMLPDMSGLDVMRRLKQETDIPVLLVTALGQGWSRVQGLDLGADDYLIKPLHLDELEARIRAVLRRLGGRPAEGPADWAPGIEFDRRRGVVLRDGRPLDLTPREARLLEFFVSNAGRLLQPQEVLTGVWGPGSGGRTQLLRVGVSRLRCKLQQDPASPALLHTVPGFGYFFGVKAADRGAAGYGAASRVLGGAGMAPRPAAVPSEGMHVDQERTG